MEIVDLIQEKNVIVGLVVILQHANAIAIDNIFQHHPRLSIVSKFLLILALYSQTVLHVCLSIVFGVKILLLVDALVILTNVQVTSYITTLCDNLQSANQFLLNSSEM